MMRFKMMDNAMRVEDEHSQDKPEQQRSAECAEVENSEPNVEQQPCSVLVVDSGPKTWAKLVGRNAAATVRAAQLVTRQHTTPQPAAPPTHQPASVSLQQPPPTLTNTHQATGGEHFLCPDCGESFARKWNCMRHRERAHGVPQMRRETTQIPCDQDGCTYKASRFKLNDHIRNFHGLKTSEWVVCPICDVAQVSQCSDYSDSNSDDEYQQNTHSYEAWEQHVEGGSPGQPPVGYTREECHRDLENMLKAVDVDVTDAQLPWVSLEIRAFLDSLMSRIRDARAPPLTPRINAMGRPPICPPQRLAKRTVLKRRWVMEGMDP